MGRPDVVLAVASAHALSLIRTDDWPMLAAELMGLGFDGEALVALAGMPRSITGWELDELRPSVLDEIGAPEVPIEEAGDVVARLLAANLRRPFIRCLATLAPTLDYPGGALGAAYSLSEYLDCDCHPKGKQEARDFERETAEEGPLDVPEALALALVGYL